MDSGWIRSGFVFNRIRLAREPIWIGAARYGFGLGSVLDLYWTDIDSRENRYGSERSDMDSVLGPSWICIAPTSIRARTDLDRVGPTWVRVGSAMALYGPEVDSYENRSGSVRPVMASDWVRHGLALTRHGFVRESIWIGSVRSGF